VRLGAGVYHPAMRQRTQLARWLLGFGVMASLVLQPLPAFADPPGPGDAPGGGAAGRPGAAALGRGTIFLTLAAIRAPASGTVFFSGGQMLPSLEQPVGSCRLKLRVSGGEIPSGTPLSVDSVTSATSAYEDRGISSVTWHFGKDDPAESLLCDTVGNVGLSQGDVEMEVRGMLKIEAGPPLD